MSLVLQPAVTAATIGVTGVLLRGRALRRLGQLIAGLATVILGIAHGTFVSGHPAEIAIPLMWVLAALAMRYDRPLLGGMLLGLSAGWELWGALGAPIALLASTRRRALIAIGLQGVVVAAMFGPFLVAGPFRMFEYRWIVTVQSPLRLFLPIETPFPWTWRVAQGLIALGTGTAVATLARRSPHVTWETPAAVVAGRLLLDPMNFQYYWLAVWIIGVLAIVEVASGARRRSAAGPVATPRAAGVLASTGADRA